MGSVKDTLKRVEFNIQKKSKGNSMDSSLLSVFTSHPFFRWVIQFMWVEDDDGETILHYVIYMLRATGLPLTPQLAQRREGRWG